MYYNKVKPSGGRLAAAAQLVGYTLERRIRVGADRRNGGQADNDDQSQHHCILDGGRAVFRHEETLYFLRKTLHNFLQIQDRPRVFECHCGHLTNL